MTQKQFLHTPVLVHEVVDLLAPPKNAVILDGTLGTGGHAEALLEKAGTNATLYGFDRDITALTVAGERLHAYGDRVKLFHANYEDASQLFGEQGIEPKVTTVILDLGFSSLELETSGRGFSFLNNDEPLDMRYDPATPGPTAASLLKSADLEQLADIFRRYGEEPHARALARAVINRRKEFPFDTVRDVVSLIMTQAARHGTLGHGHLHPATRIFQALRIAVNDELGSLERALPKLISLLVPGGRIGVISFHSLEDRIVKTAIRREAQDCLCPPEFPICVCGHKAHLQILTKHVVTASDDEQETNPRSRSAKLRVAEKI